MIYLLIYLMFFLCDTLNATQLQPHVNTPNQSNFLVITDVHLDHSTKHKMQYAPNHTSSSNDLDEQTFQELLETTRNAIRDQKIAKPQFILLLGDIVGHIRTNKDSVIKSETSVFTDLKKYFPEYPIFYIFGNNDSIGANYGPFVSKQAATNTHSPYAIAMSQAHWKNGFLSTGIHCANNHPQYPCLQTENILQGYYSALIAPGLHLISLNSNDFSNRHFGISHTAALTQLHWLRKQLATIKTKNETALIAMHIPPGKNVYNNTSFWRANEKSEFLHIINLYASNIAGILAAHTHKDEIKLIQNKDHKNITGIYITAALSTSHGNAPSIKTFYYSNKNYYWQLTDFDTFYFAKKHTGFVEINKLYNLKQYCHKKNSKNLLACLDFVFIKKMDQYYCSGNVNTHQRILWPKNIIIKSDS